MDEKDIHFAPPSNKISKANPAPQPVVFPPQAAASPQPAAPRPQAKQPPSSPSDADHKEQMRKLMPFAIAGLVGIAGAFVYMARKPMSASPFPRVSQQSKASLPRAFSPAKTTTNQLSNLKDKFNRPRIPGQSAAGLRPKSPSFPSSPRVPSTPTKSPVRAAVGSTPKKAAGATPTAKRPPKKYCLIFGRVESKLQSVAQWDVKKLTQNMALKLQGKKLRLLQKPCCRLSLGSFDKGQKNQAKLLYKALREHFQDGLLTVYKGSHFFPDGQIPTFGACVP